MSQEKVDKYKERKVNRKSIMKKEKAKRIVRRTLTGLVTLALVGWLGYSSYDAFKANMPRKIVEVDYSAVQEYLQELQAEETE